MFSWRQTIHDYNVMRIGNDSEWAGKEKIRPQHAEEQGGQVDTVKNSDLRTTNTKQECNYYTATFDMASVFVSPLTTSELLDRH
jgi:hypothetical protein